MPQARRTAKKNNPKQKTRSSHQWGLLLIVLLSGMLLGALLFGYGPFGQGLHNLQQQRAEERSQSPAELAQANNSKTPVRTEKDFQFYNVLEKDIDRVLPKNSPAGSQQRTQQKHTYILQIASFSQHAGAEELKAKLALKGFQTEIQERNGKYRLKMGPFNDRRKLKNARTKIQKTGLGLRPIGIQYKSKETSQP